MATLDISHTHHRLSRLQGQMYNACVQHLIGIIVLCSYFDQVLTFSGFLACMSEDVGT